MRMPIHRRLITVVTIGAILGALAAIAPVAAADRGHNRFIFVARSQADYGALRSDIVAAGGRIIRDMPDVDMLVAVGASTLHSLGSDAHAQGVAADHLEKLGPPDGGTTAPGTPHGAGLLGASHVTVTPDPAFGLDGLMWSIDRIDAPQAWRNTTGSQQVTVGVADTGLDFTHPELASQVAGVVDFTTTEDPLLCSTYFGYSDADWAALYGGPATTDWNGHGSWIGGNIAAALDGVGVNGIAPDVQLVALKISQWCGYAYDSEILDAFTYAANNGIDVVSISFGGYLDLTQPDQALVYKQYMKTVSYAARKGTLIVAAAGNEHVRVGLGGRVLTHGQLTLPGSAPGDYPDLYGMFEVPGGVPGVIDVSSTGNVVNASSASCDASQVDLAGNPTCKPTSDAHQQTGVGRSNQLAYYSNYGPRIDVAAPGGARKFNLPFWDGGGTPGFPYTDADGFNAWEDFSITSDWALEIPCFVGLGPDFYSNDCYSTIQGTSMATPHASAVAALIASRYPFLRHHPLAIAALLKASAQHVRGNTTPPAIATDLSAGDLSGLPCDLGYCHLAGRPISDSEAYGAGLVNAANAVGIGH